MFQTKQCIKSWTQIKTHYGQINKENLVQMKSGNTDKTTAHLANDWQKTDRWIGSFSSSLLISFTYQTLKGSVHSETERLLALLINTDAILKHIN